MRPAAMHHGGNNLYCSGRGSDGYMGLGYEGGGLNLDLDECKQHCIDDPDCKGISYFKGYNGKGGTCYVSHRECTEGYPNNSYYDGFYRKEDGSCECDDGWTGDNCDISSESYEDDTGWTGNNY